MAQVACLKSANTPPLLPHKPQRRASSSVKEDDACSHLEKLTCIGSSSPLLVAVAHITSAPWHTSARPTAEPQKNLTDLEHVVLLSLPDNVGALEEI